jgi:hypothetical protein
MGASMSIVVPLAGQSIRSSDLLPLDHGELFRELIGKERAGILGEDDAACVYGTA